MSDFEYQPPEEGATPQPTVGTCGRCGFRNVYLNADGQCDVCAEGLCRDCGFNKPNDSLLGVCGQCENRYFTYQTFDAGDVYDARIMNPWKH